MAKLPRHSSESDLDFGIFFAGLLSLLGVLLSFLVLASCVLSWLWPEYFGWVDLVLW